MVILRSALGIRTWCGRQRHAGRTIGFVPTMGALHEGHGSLLARSKRECSRTVASVFVNPAQFGPGEDFRRYPRAVRRDRSLLAAAGTDALFAPAVSTMYAGGDRTRVSVPGLESVLCGRFRPRHFAGVATVVAKLLNLVRPHRLYLGQKDFQQCAVLARMVRDLLYLPTTVVVCPTVRASDGLALSSRNAYLSAPQRGRATVVIRALRAGRAALRAGERRPARVRAAMRRVLSEEPMFRTQYAEVVSPDSLLPPRRINGRAALLVAGFLGKTRLIDNLVVRP